MNPLRLSVFTVFLIAIAPYLCGRNPVEPTSLFALYHGPRFQEENFRTGWRPLLHPFAKEKTGLYGFSAVTADNFGGAYPTLVRADFDGDGKIDLAIGVSIGGGFSSVYLFLGRDTPPSSASEFTGAKKLKTGVSIEKESLWAGDLNGDGISDLIIGVPVGEGGIVIIWGGSNLGAASDGSTILDEHKTTIFNGGAWSGANTQENFGRCVALGDFDGDGILDLASGAWGYPKSANTFGRVAIFHGRRSWPKTLEAVSGADTVFKGEGVTHHLGVYLAAGDMDGDGYSDLVFTSAFYPGPGSGAERGKVYIYYGGTRMVGEIDLSTNLPHERMTTIEDDRQGAGTCFVAVGDINGDKRKDLVLGISRYDEGRVVILKGPILARKQIFWWDHEDFSYIDAKSDVRFISGKFGQTLSVADLNSDGCDDLLVGAKGFSSSLSGPRTGEGGAFLYLGDPEFPHYLVAYDDAWHVFSGKEGTTIEFGLGASIFRSNIGEAWVAIGDPYNGVLLVDKFDPNEGALGVRAAYAKRRTQDSTWGYDLSALAANWSIETHAPERGDFTLATMSGAAAAKELKEKFDITSAWLPSIQSISMRSGWHTIDGSAAQVDLYLNLWMRPNHPHLDAMHRALRGILVAEVQPRMVRIYNRARFTGADEMRYFGYAGFGAGSSDTYTVLSGAQFVPEAADSRFMNVALLKNSETLEVSPFYRTVGHQFYVRSMDLEDYQIPESKYRELFEDTGVDGYDKWILRSTANATWHTWFEGRRYDGVSGAYIPNLSIIVEAVDGAGVVLASTEFRDASNYQTDGRSVGPLHSSAVGQDHFSVGFAGVYNPNSSGGGMSYGAASILGDLSMPAVDASAKAILAVSDAHYAGFDKEGTMAHAEGFPMKPSLKAGLMNPNYINGSTTNSRRLLLTVESVSKIKRIRVRWANRPWSSRPSQFPTIISQPRSISVKEGEPIIMKVVVPSGQFEFQWRKGGGLKTGTPVPGDYWAPPTFWSGGDVVARTTLGSYSIARASLSDAGSYDVVVRGADGLIYSQAFDVYVKRMPPAAPSVSQQPLAQSVVVGEAINLVIGVLGAPYPSIRWQKNGQDIPGTVSEALAISNAQLSDAGSYRAVVTNSLGTITSQPVSVAVLASQSRLANLSVMANFPASGVFTVGAVVGGASGGRAATLVRAIGPGLAQFGVSNVLVDPRLTVYRGQSVLQSNDNWGGASGLSAAFVQCGAFALANLQSRDAAVLNDSLAPGAYTIELSAPPGSAGTVLAEVYDMNGRRPATGSTPRLVNLSCLKQIDAKDLLTVGFVIIGDVSKRVLIRAVGPTLASAPFGVRGVMEDPKMDMFRGQSVVSTNDNWGTPIGVGAATKAEIAAVFTQVGAFPLPDSSRDSAVLALLAPGGYTVQISGGSTGGVILVEVYEVP